MARALEDLVARANFAGEFRGVIGKAIEHQNPSSDIAVHFVKVGAPSSVILRVGPSLVYLRYTSRIGLTLDQFAQRLIAVCASNGNSHVDDVPQDLPCPNEIESGWVMDVNAITQGVNKPGAIDSDVSTDNNSRVKDVFLKMYLYLPRDHQGWFTATKIQSWLPSLDRKGANQTTAIQALNGLVEAGVLDREKLKDSGGWRYRFSAMGSQMAMDWYQTRCQAVLPDADLAEVARLEQVELIQSRERLGQELTNLQQMKRNHQTDLVVAKTAVGEAVAQVNRLEAELAKVRSEIKKARDRVVACEKILAGHNKSVQSVLKRIRAIDDKLRDPERCRILEGGNSVD